MLTIFKYPLFETCAGSDSVALPAGAKILSLQVQHGLVQMWALVDTDAKAEPREFYVAGTGTALPQAARNWHFIDTFQADGGRFVFHVFEVPADVG